LCSKISAISLVAISMADEYELQPTCGCRGWVQGVVALVAGQTSSDRNGPFILIDIR